MLNLNRRTRTMWPIVAMAILILAGVVAAVSGSDRNPDRGRALILRGEARPVVDAPPGQEFVVMRRSLVNDSDGSLELVDVDFGAPSDVVEVVKVTVVSDQGVVEKLFHGTYVTYPPAIKIVEDCFVPDPRPVNGFELSPHGEADDSAELLVHLRALAPGTAHISPRFSYLQDGRPYYQDGDFTIEVKVGEETERITSRPADKDCLDAAGVRLLP